jgi:hypothetical protein
MRIRMLLTLGLMSSAFIPCGAQTIETETARLLHRGGWKVGAAAELQSSNEGTELAYPMLVEVGLTNSIEIAIEPIPYTAIRPRRSQQATGVGDLEATVVFRFLNEGVHVPAFALAGEVKVPTAKNELIGTKKADYTLYAIASKRHGHLDTHFNLSYAKLGQPAGVKLNDLFGFGVAGVLHSSARWELFAESFGTTSSGEGESDAAPGVVIVQEAAGGEMVGSIGAGRYLTTGFLLYAGVSYDNSHAVLWRSGFTSRFP